MLMLQCIHKLFLLSVLLFAFAASQTEEDSVEKQCIQDLLKILNERRFSTIRVIHAVPRVTNHAEKGHDVTVQSVRLREKSSSTIEQISHGKEPFITDVRREDTDRWKSLRNHVRSAREADGHSNVSPSTQTDSDKRSIQSSSNSYPEPHPVSSAKEFDERFNGPQSSPGKIESPEQRPADSTKATSDERFKAPQSTPSDKYSPYYFPEHIRATKSKESAEDRFNGLQNTPDMRENDRNSRQYSPYYMPEHIRATKSKENVDERFNIPQSIPQPDPASSAREPTEERFNVPQSTRTISANDPGRFQQSPATRSKDPIDESFNSPRPTRRDSSYSYPRTSSYDERFNTPLSSSYSYPSSNTKRPTYDNFAQSTSSDRSNAQYDSYLDPDINKKLRGICSFYSTLQRGENNAAKKPIQPTEARRSNANGMNGFTWNNFNQYSPSYMSSQDFGSPSSWNQTPRMPSRMPSAQRTAPMSPKSTNPEIRIENHDQLMKSIDSKDISALTQFYSKVQQHAEREIKKPAQQDPVGTRTNSDGMNGFSWKHFNEHFLSCMDSQDFGSLSTWNRTPTVPNGMRPTSTNRSPTPSTPKDSGTQTSPKSTDPEVRIDGPSSSSTKKNVKSTPSMKPSDAKDIPILTRFKDLLFKKLTKRSDRNEFCSGLKELVDLYDEQPKMDVAHNHNEGTNDQKHLPKSDDNNSNTKREKQPTLVIEQNDIRIADERKDESNIRPDLVKSDIGMSASNKTTTKEPQSKICAALQNLKQSLLKQETQESDRHVLCACLQDLLKICQNQPINKKVSEKKPLNPLSAKFDSNESEGEHSTAEDNYSPPEQDGNDTSQEAHQITRPKKDDPKEKPESPKYSVVDISDQDPTEGDKMSSTLENERGVLNMKEEAKEEKKEPNAQENQEVTSRPRNTVTKIDEVLRGISEPELNKDPVKEETPKAAKKDQEHHSMKIPPRNSNTVTKSEPNNPEINRDSTKEKMPTGRSPPELKVEVDSSTKKDEANVPLDPDASKTLKPTGNHTEPQLVYNECTDDCFKDIKTSDFNATNPKSTTDHVKSQQVQPEDVLSMLFGSNHTMKILCTKPSHPSHKPNCFFISSLDLTNLMPEVKVLNGSCNCSSCCPKIVLKTRAFCGPKIICQSIEQQGCHPSFAKYFQPKAIQTCNSNPNPNYSCKCR